MLGSKQFDPLADNAVEHVLKASKKATRGSSHPVVKILVFLALATDFFFTKATMARSMGVANWSVDAVVVAAGVTCALAVSSYLCGFFGGKAAYCSKSGRPGRTCAAGSAFCAVAFLAIVAGVCALRMNEPTVVDSFGNELGNETSPAFTLLMAAIMLAGGLAEALTEMIDGKDHAALEHHADVLRNVAASEAAAVVQAQEMDAARREKAAQRWAGARGDALASKKRLEELKAATGTVGQPYGAQQAIDAVAAVDALDAAR